ncbi:MAG: helix-hairpin-helix domain-containing protein, partial [Candidatus Altarchaeaceae archaeon]
MKEKGKEEEKEEKENQKIINIEDLPGVGPATAEKLRELGYTTIESIAVASIGELKEAGITEG